jgi:hypothetical protein
MTEVAMPRISTFAVTPASGNLDAAKLIEAAKAKLSYARGELSRIKREHLLKRLEISQNAREKMEAIEQETADALAALERDTLEQSRPAQEMIDLVKRMLG